MPIRLSLIGEDDVWSRELNRLLAWNKDVFLASSHATPKAAMKELPEVRPEVVLMDLNPSGLDGVECVRQLTTRLPGTRFILLTDHEENERLFQSFLAGADGCLRKGTPPAGLLAAIAEVQAGGALMSPQVARRVVQHLRSQSNAAPGVAELTPRERDVLAQLAQGRSYKQIATGLDMSLNTVRTRLRSIYEKLHVHSRTEAVVKFLHR